MIHFELIVIWVSNVSSTICKKDYPFPMWVFLNYIFKYSVPLFRFSTLGSPFMTLIILLGFLLYLSFSPWSFLDLYFHLILVAFLISVPLTGLSAESNVHWASFHVVFLPVMFLVVFYSFSEFCWLTCPCPSPGFVLGVDFCRHFLHLAPIKPWLSLPVLLFLPRGWLLPPFNTCSS